MEYNVVRRHQLVRGEELIQAMEIGDHFIFKLHCASGRDGSCCGDFGRTYKIAKVGEKLMFAAVARLVSPKTPKRDDQMDRTEGTPPVSRNFSVLSVPNLCGCRATP